MSRYQGLQPVTKIETGIEGFEHITLGGLPEGRQTLLVGSAGSGKTVLALQMLQIGATRLDRPGVLVTLEESGREIMRNVKRFGWDLPALEDAGKLRIIDASPLLTAERPDECGPIPEYGVEELIADNVIILRDVLKEENVRRTMQVLKMRGDGHFKGELPFTISESGISILPLAARQLKQSSSNRRISTGNNDLDVMAGGGLLRDSVCLVSGPTGGGKTLMGNALAAEGCRQGERVLMPGYEESRAQLLRNAQSWGMHIGGASENVRNTILGVPSTVPPSEHEQPEEMFQHG